MIWVNCNSVTSWSVCKWILLSSTLEDLLSGHPPARAAKKVFVPGAGRLRECKKKSLYGSWAPFPKCPLRPPLYSVFRPCQHHMLSSCCSLRIPSCLTETQAKPWLLLNNRSLRCEAPFSTKAKNKDTLVSTCPQIWRQQLIKQTRKGAPKMQLK